jgi:hypothetical protein
MRTPYSWLNSWLDPHLPELEGLPDTQKGLAKARLWFDRLMRFFESRRLTTPRQQKNYVVDVRNAIRSRWGENHPALKVVGFDEQTWTEINLATHDRVEARNQNTQFIKDPDAIVARAYAILANNKSEWFDLAVGLGVATGRRISELLGPQTTLEPKTAFSVLFSGQLKTGLKTSVSRFRLCAPPLSCWTLGSGSAVCSAKTGRWNRERSTSGTAASAGRRLTAISLA